MRPPRRTPVTRGTVPALPGLPQASRALRERPLRCAGARTDVPRTGASCETRDLTRSSRGESGYSKNAPEVGRKPDVESHLRSSSSYRPMQEDQSPVIAVSPLPDFPPSPDHNHMHSGQGAPNKSSGSGDEASRRGLPYHCADRNPVRSGAGTSLHNHKLADGPTAGPSR